MSGALGAPARAALREALADAAGVVAFADVVVRQVAHPLGAVGEWAGDDWDDDDAAGDERELAVARRLGAALGAVTARASAAGDAFDRAATELVRDVALLSACYQNLDLLPAGAAGDAVAMLVARALEGLDAHPAT